MELTSAASPATFCAMSAITVKVVITLNFSFTFGRGDGQQRQRGGKHQMLQGWQVQHKVPHNVAIN